jgi:DNA-binding HxlR family transcriptional regulator
MVIINHISYNEVPPKVEYELSNMDGLYNSILDSLCAWGKKHIVKVYGDTTSVLEDNILNK